MSMAQAYGDENFEIDGNALNSEYMLYYNKSVEEGLKAHRAGELYSDEVAMQQAAERRARILARIASQ